MAGQDLVLLVIFEALGLTKVPFGEYVFICSRLLLAANPRIEKNMNETMLMPFGLTPQACESTTKALVDSVDATEE